MFVQPKNKALQNVLDINYFTFFKVTVEDEYLKDIRCISSKAFAFLVFILVYLFKEITVWYNRDNLYNFS